MTGTITGAVTDTNGDSIENATITVITSGDNTVETEATTDATGTYSVSVPPDVYDVRATKFEYQSAEETDVVVSDGTTKTVDLTLSAFAPKLLGERTDTSTIGVRGVVGVDSGQPVGVLGEVSSSEGYGLYTPDDARVGETMDTSSLQAGDVTAGSLSTDVLNALDLDAATAGGVLATTGGTDLSTVDPPGTSLKAQGPAGDTWTEVASLNTGRRQLAVAAVDGKVYAIGGQSDNSPYETTVEEYDPGSDTWTDVASLPTGRRQLAAAAVDGTVYAVGGRSGNSAYETTVEEYDPVGDSWTSVASLPTGRSQLAAAAVDGKVYAIGGQSDQTFKEPTVEEYDPGSNTWTTVASLNTGRHQLAAAAVDGTVYAVGGDSTTFIREPSVEAYDPSKDTWTEVASMTTGRQIVGAAADADSLFAVAGDTDGTVGAYDPARELWFPVPTLGRNRSRVAAASAGGDIYAVGYGTRVDRLSGDPFDGAFTASDTLLVAVHGDDDAMVRNVTTNQVRTGDQQLLVEGGETVAWLGNGSASLITFE